MQRIIVLAVAVLLVTQVAIAAGTKKITVAGSFSSGMKVTAVCNVSSTGKISGSGNVTVETHSYPFVVQKIETGRGTITLIGKFSVAGDPPITLTAAVPSGNQTLKYVVNGKTITMAGTGTVTVVQ